MSPLLTKAASLLRQGELVAFPTETVYGLGARADREDCVAKIFQAKNRPTFDPLIAHFPSMEAAEPWAVFDERARKLGEKFWPGPLTLILPRRRGICDLATSGLPSVGVRVPAHPLALDFLREAALPVAAPSANPFVYVSPTTAQHVLQGLGNKVGLILDGGACSIGVESTIVSLASDQPRLLRPGGLPKEVLEEALGCPLAYEGHIPATSDVQAPGMLKSHYSPSRPLECCDTLSAILQRIDELEGECAVLGSSLPKTIEARHIEELGSTPLEMASNLFGALRRLDATDIPIILAWLPPPEGLGLAVRDRLIRAGGSRPVRT